MPLRDKYQPIIGLIEELNGQVIKTKEDRGYFIIEGLLNSEDEIELVKKKSEKINNINADEIKLILKVKR